MMNNLHPGQMCADLEQLWHQNFPLAKAMGLKAENFTDHCLTTSAPLVLNTNIHGTAFAGSLYSTLAMTAWGLLHLEIQVAGLEGSIIHADGNIDFFKTIQTDIVAVASFTDHLDSIEELRDTGKTRLTLTTVVEDGDTVLCQFSGSYLARLNR
jgi:thioesterase domain-containing protein